MSESNSLSAEYLDLLDPADYVFGLVHFPPGCDVKQLFSAAAEPMLQKFFRKLTKHPATPLRKRFPSPPSSQVLELTYEGSSSHTRLPFLGRYSNGGYCLRQLNVKRLQICLGNDIDGKNNVEGDGEDVEAKEAKEAEAVSASKRRTSDVHSSIEAPSKKRRKSERNHL
ncbi:hypothetical protein ECG_07724 [Echinococcus granulosus]|nr:hypothetical protein ECG_07724 [Echinococcus granulosus]